MTAFSTAGAYLQFLSAWFMGDSDETLAKWLYYRTELGREEGDGCFSGKINKLSEGGDRVFQRRQRTRIRAGQ
jgi:hypothetical protein